MVGRITDRLMRAPGNRLESLEDLQAALVAAAAIGFSDNSAPVDEPRPARSGYWLATQILAPGPWKRVQLKHLKCAYLAGYDQATFLGYGRVRKQRK